MDRIREVDEIVSDRSTLGTVELRRDFLMRPGDLLSWSHFEMDKTIYVSLICTCVCTSYFFTLSHGIKCFYIC